MADAPDDTLEPEDLDEVSGGKGAGAGKVVFDESPKEESKL